MRNNSGYFARRIPANIAELLELLNPKPSY
jgi:hypothetical protein